MNTYVVASWGTRVVDRFITRRGLLKGATGLVVAGAIPATSVTTVEAGVTWCRVDPAVKIAGTLVNFYAWLPQEFATKAFTPCEFYLKLPLGVKFNLVSTDAGFNNLGELFFGTNLSLMLKGADGSIPVECKSRVLLSNTLSAPMRLECAPENGTSVFAEGYNLGVFGRFKVYPTL